MTQRDKKKPSFDTASLETSLERWAQSSVANQPVRQANISDLSHKEQRSALRIEKKEKQIDPENLVLFQTVTQER